MNSLTIRRWGVAPSLVFAALSMSACDGDAGVTGAAGSSAVAGASGSAGQSASGNGGSAGSGGASTVVPDPRKDCGVATNPSVPELSLTTVASGLTRPVYLTQAPGDASRLFVVEKSGIIRIILDGALVADPFLDIETDVSERNEEMGLLGLAFHPDYARNGRFYLYYSTLQGGAAHSSRLAEYSVSSGDPNRADPASGRVLLEITEPEDNHNGGDLRWHRGWRRRRRRPWSKRQWAKPGYAPRQDPADRREWDGQWTKVRLRNPKRQPRRGRRSSRDLELWPAEPLALQLRRLHG
jgi:hypothetical protein